MIQKFNETGSLRVIFYANPSFAIPSLEILWKNHYQIMAVVTSPDKPAGRGLRIKKSEVKVWAEGHGMNVMQPDKLSDADFVQSIRDLKPDLQVVIAFRRIPKEIWETSPLGTINLHPSLLPQYRGAAPLNWAIVNGEKMTGITTIMINDEIDSGDIILQEEVEINDLDTAGSLHDRLSRLGAELILKTVKLIETGQAQIKRQPFPAGLKKAPKISKTDCRINWNSPAEELYNFIRGFSPYPVAWTLLKEKTFRIFNAQFETVVHEHPSGKILTDQRSFLKVASNDGFLILTEVQLEGKKVMPVPEFLKGFTFDDSSFFS